MVAGSRRSSIVWVLIALLGTACTEVPARSGDGQGDATVDTASGATTHALGGDARDADGRVSVEGVRIAESANGTNMALYADIANHGPDDALIGLRTAVAGRATLHAMRHDGGVMTMEEVRSIPVAAGATVSLRPGRLHGMLEELPAVPVVGDTVEVTFLFRSGVEVTAAAAVVDFASLAGAPSGLH